ncbi:prolipoprotein diacylglyceryl transferase [Helicobacter sp.]|uniref:prolipoprotein diacylglyceryl transferase n=1 Tax=Helicobacter sp. TaxID=218 RepID=UPI0025BA64E2|nr:prolipoprotein diacylglyceryl transferase [Helicobacter sp.]MBR2495265.1 prolipoprotein diacylglyceryl transferase [Helicobacter sp.]
MIEHYSLWNTIYAHFDPVAFSIFGINVHWYGIAYMCALVFALFVAHFFIRINPTRFPISKQLLDSYFIWAEIGVIIGARIGYVLIYDPNRFWYLAHPLEVFNPFDSFGNFVGIRGMSFHGGVIGFLLVSYVFIKAKRVTLLPLLDLVAISVPLAYVFGRVGNFLNHELFGRVVSENDTLGQRVGILVDGVLRYPSQLLEAILEGLVVFIIIIISSRVKLLTNALIGVYGVSYGLMRFVAEYWREPDPQLGLFGSLSMGQILSLIMIILGVLVIIYAMKNNLRNNLQGTYNASSKS